MMEKASNKSKNYKPTRAASIFILVLCSLCLTGCNNILGNDGLSPANQVQDTPFPEHVQEDYGEPLPIQEGDLYTPIGLKPGEVLVILREPSLDASPAGEIPAGTTGIFASEGLIQDDNKWLYINHQEDYGWVEMKHLGVYQGELPKELILQGILTLTALKANDYEELVNLVHPDLCLRFSPYPYLDDSNLVFCPGEFMEMVESDQFRIWGSFDGTGDPIRMTFTEYHQQFILDSDYILAPIIGLNQEVSYGNSINNISDIYPDGMMIEYHFPGFDPKYGGMDWRSLRLVYIKENSTWYLVAIVHGEWTI